MMSLAPAGQANLALVALVRAALLSSLTGPRAPHPPRVSFPAQAGAPFCQAHDVLAWTRIALISSLVFSHASRPLLPPSSLGVNVLFLAACMSMRPRKKNFDVMDEGEQAEFLKEESANRDARRKKHFDAMDEDEQDEYAEEAKG
ncbi:hypothetical protein M885DRAFT_572713 [Pelagophyceae sp. CCMP2097]|nr:hypothetical protein M885DRAFT_572713 [Pelagophyceae sp. CCMP2097]